MKSSEMYDIQVADVIIDTQDSKTLVVDGFKESWNNFNPERDYFFSADTTGEPLDIEAVFMEGKRVGNILRQKMNEKQLDGWLLS